jgi:hypothetical protein
MFCSILELSKLWSLRLRLLREQYDFAGVIVCLRGAQDGSAHKFDVILLTLL